jgi:N-ethylmaleimide reductase
MVRFYAERTTAGGLVVCEAASVSPGIARDEMPGLHSPEQVNHWRLVTDAIREAQGVAISQLGLDGEQARAATQALQALDEDRLEHFVRDYRNAAENAGDAGFEGVELQASHGALPQRLLHGEMQDCAGSYQGGADGCCRFLEEVLGSLVGIWGRNRVGLCLEPLRPEGGRRIAGMDILAFYARLFESLDALGIAWVHLVEPGFGGVSPAPERPRQPRMSTLLRPYFTGNFIISGGLDPGTAREELRSGRAQGVAFGRALLGDAEFITHLRGNDAASR